MPTDTYHKKKVGLTSLNYDQIFVKWKADIPEYIILHSPVFFLGYVAVDDYC